MADLPMRTIRSFVKRRGRITAAQQRALERLWPRWGIPFREERLDLDSLFARSAPRVLDIGFGDGEALLTMAANHPRIDYLGVEVYDPGIGHLLVLLEKSGITNVRIVARDVVEVLSAMLPNESFDAVNLFFPDPWPKKRHHKRRLVQEAFVGAVAKVLKDRGLLHVATDSSAYAEHTLDVLERADSFARESPSVLTNDPLAFRPPTKFERRGRRLGNEVADLFFRKLRRPG